MSLVLSLVAAGWMLCSAGWLACYLLIGRTPRTWRGRLGVALVILGGPLSLVAALARVDGQDA